jgi:hypothetical protein
MMPTPLGLPYPLPADPVSAGAADIRALAEAVDALTHDLAYAEFTIDTVITATVEASANTVVSIPATVFTATPITVEFFSAQVAPDSAAAGRYVLIFLFQDGASIGRLASVGTPSAGFMTTPVYLSRKLTPTAGSHTYSVRAIVNAGTGHIYGGLGGAGNIAPGFIRVCHA